MLSTRADSGGAFDPGAIRDRVAPDLKVGTNVQGIVTIPRASG